jgi:hypothetical protein
LWETTRGRSEVLDFQDFFALLKKPAVATLPQQINDLALFRRSLWWRRYPTLRIGKIVESLLLLGTLLEETA